ncbi:MAG: T3SS effector HopA1 family protein [Hydrococcus sp. Prado102]|nr:T3SS effector HopA1 family protein [Hydrococcus sp. Prado102]
MQLLNAERSRLQSVLQDLTHHLEIQPNFSIIHPDYKPLELPAESVAHFQTMPPEIQQKYLSLQLRSFLYGIYYNGSMRSHLAKDTNTDTSSLNRDLENNTMLGVDLKLYMQLHESNQGEGYFDSGWVVLRQEEDDTLAVKKGELTLHIKPEEHLQPEQRESKTGDTVAIRMPRNLVQNGFYMAVGNNGAQGRHSDIENTVRIYFNLTPQGAVAVMKQLTQQLNAASVPFSFKMLYNPADYGRYDSGVLYFDKNGYDTIQPILKAIYTVNQDDFNPDTPLFTKQLAPGLSVAEEPDRKFAERESFGMNRCQIVANGLLSALEDSPEGRLNAILEQFTLLNLDVQRPYLNANSEDIYTLLDL